MEKDQREKYLAALAGAIALVVGQRNEDYNNGGVGLRDYWAMNGIKSPLQMVDMKIKRARSQLATWDVEQMGIDMPVPTKRQQVEKLTESMLDLINYAAFVICEAESLADDHAIPHDNPMDHSSLKKSAVNPVRNLWIKLTDAVVAWQENPKGPQ